MSDVCDMEAVISAAQLAVEPRELGAGAIYAMVRSDGSVSVVDTMEYADSPARYKRNPQLYDVDSFIAYMMRHCCGDDGDDEDRPEIFADEHAKFVAILDPNGWRTDRVTLALEESPEWETWMKWSGQMMTQAQFADFLEDQLSTIVAPDGATLLEIAQSMEANTKVDWKSAEWLANGQRSFKYDEQVEAKAGRTGQLEIPAQFTLALRPFLGADPFEVKANLRYRINDGELRIGFKLVEPERRLEAAVDEVAAKITEETKLTVLRGWPV